MNTKCCVAFLWFTLCSASSARAETLEWIRQLGTSESDASHGVSADGLGSVYISGYTTGSLRGPNAGDWGLDAFLSKYDVSGMLEWTRQLGTSSDDSSRGVSADGLGSVYISGWTLGSLEGANAGESDAFLSKYDASGTLEWTRQLGTSGDDRSYDVSADRLGSVYITGRTDGSLDGINAGFSDAFLSKYDASGTLEWTRQLGTSMADRGRGISADGLGSVYISGYTTGNLDGINAGFTDAFLSKYDASGTLEWTRQLGSSGDDRSYDVSADRLGSVYISGWTLGSLEGASAGESDAFLSKYDASGTLEWTRQLGTSDWEDCWGVSADGLGNVYISGGTEGSLGGASAGDRDVFLSKYDASGALEWTQQLGSSEFDRSRGVSADGLGSVFISGGTQGSLGGPYVGGHFDAFVAKFTDPLLGDVNHDGVVNGLDVDPFVDVLLSGPYQAEADMNEDQVVNGLDVDPFVGAVVGVGGADVADAAASVPESSTLALAALGSLGLIGCGWRGRQHRDPLLRVRRIGHQYPRSDLWNPESRPAA